MSSVEPTNLEAILSQLAARRPVFHSEADFQHAFAWQLQIAFPDADVRLEYPVSLGGKVAHVDIWISSPHLIAAIELKYKTRGLNYEAASERFVLREHSAQDVARYDFCKDVERIESVAREIPGRHGIAIMLTNDSAYWNAPGKQAPVDAMFRLEEGRILCGELGWPNHAGAGTVKNREGRLKVLGPHRLSWRRYAQLPVSRYGEFRYLWVDARAGSVV